MPQKGKKNADHLLLLALACGATIEGVARQSGLSEATVYRRLRDADFRRQIQELRAEMVQRTAATLTAAGSESVKTLLALQQATVPAAVRLGAARAVLEMGLKLREAADVDQRLTALEQRQAESQVADYSGASA
jgi:AcrR family transcriptional regulator